MTAPTEFNISQIALPILHTAEPAESLPPQFGVPTVTSPPSPFRVRVLYVFAGKERKNDVAHFLKEMEATEGFQLELTELDLLRDLLQDVTREDVASTHVQA